MLVELEILQAVDLRSLTVTRRHDPEFTATWKTIQMMTGLGYFETLRSSPASVGQEAALDNVRIDGLSETGKARFRELTRVGSLYVRQGFANHGGMDGFIEIAPPIASSHGTTRDRMAYCIRWAREIDRQPSALRDTGDAMARSIATTWSGWSSSRHSPRCGRALPERLHRDHRVMSAD